MRMRVYVASKFENVGPVREAQRLLKAKNHLITHDWTHDSIEGLSEDAAKDYLRRSAHNDYQGVMDAEAILLINYPKGCGMFTEFGIALAAGKKLVVVDGFKPGTPMNIFFHLPQVVHYNSIEAAVEYLDGWWKTVWPGRYGT